MYMTHRIEWSVAFTTNPVQYRCSCNKFFHALEAQQHEAFYRTQDQNEDLRQATT